jgi:hypothetical protein
MQSLSPRRLSVEQLEDRTTPTTGVPWFDGTSLTVSFVPDGADVTGSPNSLFALLNSTAAQPQWQREALRAIQTWATQANLNVGLVADGGQPMGTPGAPQKDIRFGDIRIGARPLAVGPSYGMAAAIGFSFDTGTWAGDVVLNDRYRFGVGDVPGQQYDLFSVLVHEFGHSMGLLDTWTDPTSVMYGAYQPRTGLGAADVAAIRQLYGARQPDAFEGPLGNGTTATAYDLTANGNRTAVAADVTGVTDVDVYRFTAPAGSTGVTGLTVNLQAAGISLLTARVTVLDAWGNSVASAVTTDPLNNNLSVAVPNYQPGATYFVRVAGAGTDVFSTGAYLLRLNYSPHQPAGTNGSLTNSYYTNLETFWSNDTLGTAQTLAPVSTTKPSTFTVTGLVTGGGDADWYRVTPAASPGFTGTLYVGVMISSGNLLPAVTVHTASGAQLPAAVVMNQDGSYVVQLPGQATGTTYLVRVAAEDPAGPRNSGGYLLGATLSPFGSAQFHGLNADTLTAGKKTVYTRMTATENGLTQFALSVSAAAGAPRSAVRATVFDSAGRAVFTVAAEAGRPLRTGTVWLPAGTYTVAFRAATWDPAATLPAVTFDFAMRDLSDPIDPVVVDPISPPPDDQPITTEPTTPIPPPDPIVDPISDPFLEVRLGLVLWL